MQRRKRPSLIYRRIFGDSVEKDLPILEIIIDYNFYMNGIDIGD